MRDRGRQGFPIVATMLLVSTRWACISIIIAVIIIIIIIIIIIFIFVKVGSFSCPCHDGYQNHQGNQGCFDIDECTLSEGVGWLFYVTKHTPRRGGLTFLRYHTHSQKGWVELYWLQQVELFVLPCVIRHHWCNSHWWLSKGLSFVPVLYLCWVWFLLCSFLWSATMICSWLPNPTKYMCVIVNRPPRLLDYPDTIPLPPSTPTRPPRPPRPTRPRQPPWWWWRWQFADQLLRPKYKL